MASNASDDGQTNTSALSTARFNPTVPTNLQGTSDNSVIGNTDALTTEFELKDYTEIDWTRLLGYYIPHLITGKCYGPTQQYGYNIKHSKTGKQYQVCKLCHKKKAHIRHLYLDTGTANHSRHMLNEYNIGNFAAEKAKQRQSVFKQLHL